MIRQKNGADTLYMLRTSRSSGDLLLTNDELPRVASRRREVADRLQKTVQGLRGVYHDREPLAFRTSRKIDETAEAIRSNLLIIRSTVRP